MNSPRLYYFLSKAVFFFLGTASGYSDSANSADISLWQGREYNQPNFSYQDRAAIELEERGAIDTSDLIFDLHGPLLSVPDLDRPFDLELAQDTQLSSQRPVELSQDQLPTIPVATIPDSSNGQSTPLVGVPPSAQANYLATVLREAAGTNVLVGAEPEQVPITQIPVAPTVENSESGENTVPTEPSFDSAGQAFTEAGNIASAQLGLIGIAGVPIVGGIGAVFMSAAKQSAAAGANMLGQGALSLAHDPVSAIGKVSSFGASGAGGFVGGAFMQRPGYGGYGSYGGMFGTTPYQSVPASVHNTYVLPAGPYRPYDNSRQIDASGGYSPPRWRR